MTTNTEIEEKFWKALKSDMTLMLGLVGVEEGHAQPMTAQLDGDDRRAIWFFTAKDADLVLILTEWDAVKKIDLKKLKSVMACPVIVDGRNVFNPEEIRALGFTYHSVGRN